MASSSEHVSSSSSSSSVAFVTLLSGDDYVWGARVLGLSLREVRSAARRVCLVTHHVSHLAVRPPPQKKKQKTFFLFFFFFSAIYSCQRGLDGARDCADAGLCQGSDALALAARHDQTASVGAGGLGHHRLCGRGLSLSQKPRPPL